MRSSRKMVLSGLFAAMMAICAWLSIPVLDVAVTMQTFALCLALLLQGGRWGTVSILTYLLLGMVGLPVFSGFRGGPGALLGVTGGYLWGFLLTGLCFWMLEKWSPLLGLLVGIAACYACGSVWFLVYSGGGFWVIFLRCVAPYLIPDGIKIYLAWTLSKQLKKYV